MIKKFCYKIVVPLWERRWFSDSSNPRFSDVCILVFGS